MGQKLAAYTATGVITAFYDTSDSPPPADATTLEISDAEWQACLSAPGYTVSGGALATPAPPTAEQLLGQAQAAQTAAIQAACSTAILGNFTSAGLGAANAYGCDAVTQTNIALAAMHGGSLWCQPSNGAWALTAHTATQAIQVQADMWTHIQAQQATYAGLLATIGAATTVVAVQAVVWP